MQNLVGRGLHLLGKERIAWYLMKMFKACNIQHGTIIQIGITCNNTHCYKRDSACRWHIVKNAKIF